MVHYLHAVNLTVAGVSPLAWITRGLSGTAWLVSSQREPDLYIFLPTHSSPETDQIAVYSKHSNSKKCHLNNLQHNN